MAESTEPEILKYRLQKNYTSVLRDLEPRKVVSYLYQEGIFDEDDMDEVQDERTRKKQAELLLSILKRRGVQGYNVFVDALSETQPHLASLLQKPVQGEKFEKASANQLHCSPTENDINASAPANGYVSQSYVDSGGGSRTGYPETPEQNSTAYVRPTNLNLIPAHYQPNEPDVYKMKSSPRGLAVIINYYDFVTDSAVTGEELGKREGSEVDEKSLVDLFNGLNFKTQTLIDLDKDELMTSLEKISKSDLSSYDCFVLCIMSHGREGYFYASDGGKIMLKDVLEKFNNAKCKTLCGKPKLYFIQACRGKLSDSGAIVKDGPSGNPTEHEEPQKQSEKPQYSFEIKRDKASSTADQADQLLAYSCVEGYSSYRNTRSGSRFIRSLVEVFRVYAGIDDVQSMLTRVIRKVNSEGDLGSKQVPKPETTLTKKVFFWPGLNFD